MPTWFVDFNIPLVHEKYALSGLVDNRQIFPTGDSLGMQLVFEGDIPDTSIDESYLEVPVNKTVDVPSNPVSTPAFDIAFDTTFSFTVTLVPGGELVDTSGVTFTIPPTEPHVIDTSSWNSLARDGDYNSTVDIHIFSSGDISLPAMIQAINALVIAADQPGSRSYYHSAISNIGLPKPIINSQFGLLTDTQVPLDTLAFHDQDSRVGKDSTYTDSTSLALSRLGNNIRMQFAFGLEEETQNQTLTIDTGDSLKIRVVIGLAIAGIDSADVSIARTDLSPSLPGVTFPSDVEIYSGVFRTGTPLSVNRLAVSNLRSDYPFDIDFRLNFRNFIPPAPSTDSVKVEATLKQGITQPQREWNLDGYTFANPGDTSQPLTGLDIEIVAILDEQQSTLPLDGSVLGDFSARVEISDLYFDTLQANLIREFPPSNQSISGMPTGFSGMAFTDVRIEFEMLNEIQLPVILSGTLTGTNQAGDSIFVPLDANIAIPTGQVDTAKTIIRLSRDGTTTLVYDSPSATVWSDSTTRAPGAGEATIVDLLSFNPATISVNTAARIDGRGIIVPGKSIGGKYRMIAPFEVRMASMTFIPVNESPLEEMDWDLRNKIRSSLFLAEVTTRVINHIPTGGEISILMSNRKFFPIDRTTRGLSAFQDSMVTQHNWSPTDSVYLITSCDSLDPALGLYHIFDVMSDYRDCIDGLVYLVRSTNNGVDTVVSYIDTLLKVVLPDPTIRTTANTGFVDRPGDLTTVSSIDTNRIWLITSLGDHYTAPRFHLNGSPIDPLTGDTLPVYLALSDYLEIKSFITFRISSTGMFETTPRDIVVTYPNGGEVINVLNPVIVRWRTFGTVNKVNIDYSMTTSPVLSTNADWTSIATSVANVDSFVWDPSLAYQTIPATQRDSIRIRISAAKSAARDMSGWYFTLTQSLLGPPRPGDKPPRTLSARAWPRK